MIQLLLGLPALDAGGFTVSAYDASWNSFGANEYEGGGSIYADVTVASPGHSRLVVYTGANLDTLRFVATDTLTLDASTWSVPLEVGPRWEWGQGRFHGYADLGLGMQLRLALPDYLDGLAALAAATHGTIGVVGASGPIRPLVAMRTEGAASLASISADILVPEGTVSLNWTAMSFRATLFVGVQFGAVSKATPTR